MEEDLMCDYCCMLGRMSQFPSGPSGVALEEKVCPICGGSLAVLEDGPPVIGEPKFLLVPAEGDVDEDEGLTRQEIVNQLSWELSLERQRRAKG